MRSENSGMPRILEFPWEPSFSLLLLPPLLAWIHGCIGNHAWNDFPSLHRFMDSLSVGGGKGKRGKRSSGLCPGLCTVRESWRSCNPRGEGGIHPEMEIVWKRALCTAGLLTVLFTVLWPLALLWIPGLYLLQRFAPTPFFQCRKALQALLAIQVLRIRDFLLRLTGNPRILSGDASELPVAWITARLAAKHPILGKSADGIQVVSCERAEFDQDLGLSGSLMRKFELRYRDGRTGELLADPGAQGLPRTLMVKMSDTSSLPHVYSCESSLPSLSRHFTQLELQWMTFSLSSSVVWWKTWLIHASFF